MPTASRQPVTFSSTEIEDLLVAQLERHRRIGNATIGGRGRATQAVMACGVLRIAILFEEACNRKRTRPLPSGSAPGGPRI